MLSFQTIAASLKGRVVSVHDGDTCTLLMDGNVTAKIRLAEIDAPESKQAYGKRAKQALSNLVFGKTVSVNVISKDRYGRIVGRIYVNEVDVNASLISQGAAWVYLKYMTDPSLLELQEIAQKNKTGLWGLAENQRIPPWEWRHPDASAQLARMHKKTPRPGSMPASSFECAGKKVCREMTSCEEALFYLVQCGVYSLDGDHDGTPCNRLCR